MPGDTNNDGTCVEADGELCGEVETEGAGNDPDALSALAALDEEAGTLGQSAVEQGKLTAPAFTTSLTTWAGNAGGSCTPTTLAGRFNIVVDFCQGVEVMRTILECLLWALTGWYLFQAWGRMWEA